MDIEIIAETVPGRTTFEDGAHKVVNLMLTLEKLPQFKDGWYSSSGFRLSRDNIDKFIETEKQELDSEAKELDSFLFVSDTISRKESYGISRPTYCIIAEFGSPGELPTNINLGLHSSLVTMDLCRHIIRIMLDWDTIQHVSICDEFYRNDDTPLDFCRRGIGWAGWVPFHLTPEQVPEAVVLDPLEGGTFVACQNRWITADWPSIQRAQALELRLNSLGVLPTFEDLAKGNWGERADVMP